MKLVQQHIKGLNIFYIFHFVTERLFKISVNRVFTGENIGLDKNLMKYYYTVFHYTVIIFILFENWMK